MSEDAKAYRKANRDKADRLVRVDPKGRVDASDYTPPDALDADVKTGARPISKRAFKRGGMVMGAKAAHHAGRAKRKAGGELTADSLQNRSMKSANDERDGTKHVGAFKKGGKAHRKHHADGGTANQNKDEGSSDKELLGLTKTNRRNPYTGGNEPEASDLYSPDQLKRLEMSRKRGGRTHPDVAEDKALIRKMVKAEARTGKKHGGMAPAILGTRPDGGRVARKHGGKAAKGKTNVNIIIAGHGAQGAPQGTPPGTGPTMPPVMPRPPMMPPGAPAGLPPGAGAPPMPMPPPGAGAPPPGMMPRKAGGRVYPIDTGSGGAKARLDKIKSYGP